MEMIAVLRWMYPGLDQSMMRGRTEVFSDRIGRWDAALGVQPTAAEMAAAEPAAQAAWDAAEAERIAAEADRADLKAQFATDRDKLQSIIDEAAWSNGKRDAALKDLAQIQRRLLKAVKALVL